MYKIYIVYDKKSDIDLFKNTSFKDTFLVEYYDMTTRKGQKDGYKLKGEWGARNNPFCIIYNEDKPYKAFYSENNWEENAIIQLIDFLQNKNN